MPPTSAVSGSVRPASVINEEIRRLVDAGGLGSEEYLRLLVEWEAAVRAQGVRGDVRPAA
ncbi:hypothetical protein [Streptomyces sp. NPDC056682]|uniref:hypothetical protein n=1 Tax=Streptomyces sp. NPDC056682 TaxID=3345909 RepID=UPI003687724F